MESDEPTLKKGSHQSVGVGIFSINKKTVDLWNESSDGETNEAYRRLAECVDRWNFFIRLSGLCDRPSRVFTNRVPFAFKLYCWFLATASALFTIKAILFHLKPALAPGVAVSAHEARQNDATGLVLILFSILCTFVRVAVVHVCTGAHKCVAINRTMTTIRHFSEEDPDFVTANNKHYQNLVRLANITAFLLFGIHVFSVCAFFFRRLPIGLNPLTHWYTYSVLFEIFLNTTAWINANMMILLFTLGPIRASLRFCKKKFQHALRPQQLHDELKNQVQLLQEAVDAHDRCWELIRDVDKIASLIIGASLTLAVPIVAIVGTNLLITKQVYWQDYLGMSLWSFGAFMSGVSSVFVAAIVHDGANAPEHLLLRASFKDQRVQSTAILFLQRFTHNEIGFTYFGFGTVTKNSLLTLLSLMTTYLLIGIQLKGPSSGIAPLRNISRHF